MMRWIERVRKSLGLVAVSDKPLKGGRPVEMDWELVDSIKQAHQEWVIAQKRIDYAVGKDQIDYAIYAMEAAEKRYEMLIKQAKQSGMFRGQVLRPKAADKGGISL